MNNKRTIYEFWIFGFYIFLFSNIAILAYFDTKLQFFIIEITLKLLHKKNIYKITLTEAG